MKAQGFWLKLTVVVLVALVAAGCRSASNSPSASSGGGVGNKTTLLVGFSASLTGSLANEGKLTKDGYQFWADTINDKGGLKVGGKALKIQLKYYDDQSDANTAASNTDKLISQDKVDFILGPYSSALNLTAQTVAEKYHYVFVDTEGATTQLFNKGYKYTFTDGATGPQYPSQAIAFLAQENPKPKLAVVYADDAFSKEVGQAATSQAKEKGLDVVVSQQYTTGLKDFSPLITQMKSAGAQVVFGAGHADEAIQIVKQEQQLDFHPAATIQTVGVTTPGFVQALGSTAEGQMGTANWIGTVESFKDDLFGTAPQYAAAFKQKLGYDPDYHNAQATAGAEILGLAIEKANSLNQDQVLAAVHGLDIMTFQGPFKLNADGTNANALTLLGQIQNGKFVAVYPDKYASSKPLYPAR